ncbi:MAG: HypC/HybG/HupF family hydrogenase formation chaperone [Candidatus Methanomethylophilaceae archaeon]|jgi:hydrogenase expression/formation protein HypC
MCLAVPGKIVKIEGETADIDFGGVIRQASVAMIDAEVGQWAVIHAGYAIEVMDEDEARDTLKLWNEVLDHDGVEYR